jgi:modulator of FtsH protease HflC
MSDHVNKLVYIITVPVVVVILLLASGALYTIDETQQVVVTQFGQPIGEPITDAGLYFKIPFIQHANYFDKRILQWDGHPNQIPTKDKRYIWVDTTARWKIVDALTFLQSVTNEMGAHARLDDVIDSATRDYITGHNLVEIVRNTNRLMEDEILSEASDEFIFFDDDIEKISIGRDKLTRQILEQSSRIVPQYGIQLIDVRIKRINYVKEVQERVYERMISERKRAAEQYRSEGQGRRAEIEGQTIKELDQIRSEAYKVSEQKKGEADAEATNIYAAAYNKDPEFYAFLETLDTYKHTIDKDTFIILGTDSEYFEYLKGDSRK